MSSTTQRSVRGRPVGTRVNAITALLLLSLLVAMPASADGGCRTGAVPMGNAYVLANPMYAMFFGDLGSYLAANRVHFTADGDAIRCARRLSQALTSRAVSSYDPEWQRSQDRLRTRLEGMGMSAGPQQASPSAQLYAVGRHLEWLARVLPPAAAGDYGPMWTPRTQEEQMRLFGAQMLQVLLQDPSMREVFRQTEPLIREAAESEYRMLIGWAAQLPR